MPKPAKGEKRADYISRCVHQLKQEDPKRPTKECLAQCYSMWREAHPGGDDMMSEEAKKVMN